MRGWKARIGLIVPSSNCNVEPSFNMIVPEGVSVHSARIPTPPADAEMDWEPMLREMTSDENISRAARMLGDIPTDVLSLVCTSASFVGGVGDDAHIIRVMEETTGIPSTTTTTSVLKALKALNLRKIAFGAPYPEHITATEAKYLQDMGFEVTTYKGLGIGVHDQISRKTPNVAYNLVMELYRKTPEADGFFISCTSFRLEEYLDMLEANIKKPVVTSIQASIWDALRMSGVLEPISGYGLLLKEH